LNSGFIHNSRQFKIVATTARRNTMSQCAKLASNVREQLARGGLLLWVNVHNTHEEQTALEVLRAHSAHDVHIHEISAQ